MNKRKIVAIIMCVMSVLVLSIGITYAYFNNLIEGSGSKFTVTTGELKLIYTDTMAIAKGSISPGFSVTKTFTVENTTDNEAYYKMYYHNLINTFVNTQDLTITITSTNNGGTLSKTSIPSSSIESNIDIIEEIAIGGNTIQEYTLTIEYADAEYDQSADMGKQLSGTIEIDVIESISRKVIVRSNNESYGTVSPGEVEVENKGSATFTLNANEGYKYISNTCNGNVEDNILTIENIESDITCEVEFGIKTYSINVSSNNTNYGTITQSANTVNHGESITVTLSPETGYEYVSNTCGEEVNNNEMIISNITSSKSCTVTFTPITYTITYNLNSGTQGSNAVTSYNVTTSTFSLPTPTRTGYIFNGWYETSTFTGSAVTQITKGSTGNKTYYAKWTLNTYNVNVTSTNNTYGTVSPTSQVVNHGSNATITLSPATGYKYSSNTCGGTVSNNVMTISSVTTAKTCTVTFEQVSYVAGCAEGTLCAQIANDNPNRAIRSTFNAVYTTSNNGNTIYTATGEGGKTTYYFAGSVTNNYVKFGTNSSGAELWWRIVRINEDNSVRLIYAGTSATDTAAFISTSPAFNASYNMSYYVGYERSTTQHGTGTNSDIKNTIDTWYTNNLSEEDKYISQTAIYCNDRTVADGYTWSTYGTTFYYSAHKRLTGNYAPSDTTYYPFTGTTVTPTFACSENADRFTVSSTTGNGALENPIALITADEVVYAGGLYGTNNTSYYIYQNASSGADWWWTMSPFNWINGSGSGAFVFNVGGSGWSTFTGYLSNGVVNGTSGVRPVTSLKSCVKWVSGNGTSGNPYTVSIDSTCSSAIN